MKLNSIALFVLALAMFVSTSACSKKSSSSSGRDISTVDTPPPGNEDDDTVVDDDTRTDEDDEEDVDEEVVEQNPENILLNNYRDSVPTTKVCNKVLQSRNVTTLKKFFNWDIQNLEGPVTVCIEVEDGEQVCPNGEDYCDKYPSKIARVRIEYEDDFKFWYYDSAKETNKSKLISYVGGSGSNNVEIIIQDVVGFFRVEGTKNTDGSYGVNFSFADRPSYTSARNYDIANNYTSTSLERRAATLWDMKLCATSASGTARTGDGSNCASRFVLSSHFFKNLNVDYSQTNIVDTALWVQNQVTIARQYLTNQFPTQFAQFSGYTQGVFGRVTINGL